MRTRHRHARASLLLLAAATSLLTTLPGAAAYASNPSALVAPAAPAADSGPSCDALVRDGADVLDVREVRAAVRQVQRSRGAQVRVRTFRSVPGGNLDRRIAAALDRCEIWQDVNRPADPKNNLLVLAVSVEDRTSGLYYGSTFAPVLDTTWPQVQADTMNPRFAEDDFTGGMVAALDAIDGAIDPPARLMPR